MKQAHLILKNEITEIEKIQSFLEELSPEWDFSGELVFELNLLLEEYVVNVIHHAYSDNAEHEIKIFFTEGDNSISILIEDDGNAFDLTEEPTLEGLNKPVEERKIGGLGVHFIKSLADHVSYQRTNGLNKLTLIKHIKN
ncbi:MAG: ATP-binding protein [Bacteroidales bacterium]|jgi:anti-sigma regulatory factor (Ser/Thr protein kinase)|nr:ATP-binding protein [Bacteroidales bacterium]